MGGSVYLERGLASNMVMAVQIRFFCNEIFIKSLSWLSSKTSGINIEYSHIVQHLNFKDRNKVETVTGSLLGLSCSASVL